jgi:cytochrome c553
MPWIGKKIFDEGLPELMCRPARPVTAARRRARTRFPRLTAQLYEYTVDQLTGWAKVRGEVTAVDTSAIMAPTARNLTSSQIEAVAA